MTLPLPQLDQRTWEDLLREGLARIPRRAPDWTDHNLHDPGITLIELLAYKTEQLLYQSNRVSQRLLRNVYGLLDPNPFVAPTSVLCFSGVSTKVSLPTGTIFEQATVKGESQLLVPRRLQIACVHDPSMDQNSGVNDKTRLPSIGLLPLSGITITTDGDTTAGATQRLYAGTGFSSASRAQANRIADTPSGAPSAHSMAKSQDGSAFSQLLFTITLNREVNPGPQKDVAAQSEQELNAEQRTTCETERWTADDCCVNFGIYFEVASDSDSQIDLPEAKSEATSRLRWLGDDNPITDWLDETGDLSRSGIVRLPVNSGVEQIHCIWEGDFPWPAHRVIRRIVPNAVRAEHALSARDAGLDVADVHYKKREKDRSVFVATRELPVDRNGFQTLDLKARFVALTVEVRPQKKALRDWNHCQSLLSKGQGDRCYEIDGTVLRFGNGKYGAKLPEDCCVCVTCKFLEPTHGISVGTKWKPRWNPASTTESRVRQEYEAKKERAIVCSTIEAPPNISTDGIDSKIQRQVDRLNASHELRLLANENCGTLDGLTRRRVLEIPAPEVAVTPADFERLALETPAVRIMRARAFAETDINSPGLPGHGTVSVIVLPDLTLSGLANDLFSEKDRQLLSSVNNNADRERMCRQLLKILEDRIQHECGSSIERVETHLQAKQSMGGQLIVSSPKLWLVAIHVTLCGPHSTSASKTVSPATIEQSLREYLNPFTGGRNGTGLTWGEPVRKGEITAMLGQQLESMDDAAEVTVECEVEQLTKCFPWSMPLAVVYVDITNGRRADDA